MANRDLQFSTHMTDTEALMWMVEKDPWLSAAMGTVAVLDTSIDYELLLRRMSAAIVEIPRLHQRVAGSLNGVAPPRWVTDSEFQLTDHIREVSLPSPGSDRQLFDLTAEVMNTPFDRSRPLWGFTVVQGLEGGRSALITKLHHSISDGIGAIRIAEFYMDIERNPAEPDEVDLREFIELATAANPAPDGFQEVVTSSFGHLARRQLGLARRMAGEVALWGADPKRVGGVVDQATSAAKVVQNQLGGSSNTRAGGSPLWQERSRHRHFEGFSVEVKPALAAAKALGGKLNDFFVAGSVMAASRYHAERGVDVDAFNVSFVVSTRSDGAAGGNSFTPVMVAIPGEPLPGDKMLPAARDAMAARQAAARSGSTASAELLAGVATLLPTSVLTRTGRARAAKQDYATSNLRASPIPLYMAGAMIDELYPIGPVAGTAFNMTAMSYVDRFNIGLFIDPVAVDAPGELRTHLIDAYDELITLGGDQ